jgi:hypothetical protein
MHCRIVLCTHVVPVYTCIKYEHGSPCDVKTHGAASLAVCTAQIPGFPSSVLKEGRRKNSQRRIFTHYSNLHSYPSSILHLHIQSRKAEAQNLSYFIQRQEF